jgi:hypothetical protein
MLNQLRSNKEISNKYFFIEFVFEEGLLLKGNMKKKPKSTYEAFIENDEQKALLDKEYEELLISELLIAAMERDHIS